MSVSKGSISEVWSRISGSGLVRSQNPGEYFSASAYERAEVRQGVSGFRVASNSDPDDNSLDSGERPTPDARYLKVIGNERH